MKPKIYYRMVDVFIHTGSRWDSMATTKDKAISFAHENINPEPLKVIDTDLYSKEYSLAHSGETINDRFRSDSISKVEEEIASMVSTHSTKVDLILYRGVNEHVYKLMKQNAKGFKDADLFEKGFMQCSLVKGQEIPAEYKLRIYVPAGSCVIYLGNVNDEQDYYEVDIQHGAKLRIASMDREYINCLLLSKE